MPRLERISPPSACVSTHRGARWGHHSPSGGRFSVDGSPLAWAGRPLLVGLLLLGGLGCGGPKEAEDPTVVHSAGLSDTPAPAPVIESVDTPLTELQRAQVVKVIDDGLGKFLQTVELEASLNSGKFEGFRIVRFTAPEEWRGVGLLPGDVVTSINDQPIERPEQAHAAFVALRTAPALEVSYLRGDRPMRLSLPIVGPNPEPAAPASSAASAPAPAKAEPAREEKPTSDKKKRAP